MVIDETEIESHGFTQIKHGKNELKNGKVIVELKVAKEYNPQDEPQLLNELKATGIEVGLLINFGRKKVGFKRFVY